MGIFLVNMVDWVDVGNFFFWFKYIEMWENF